MEKENACPSLSLQMLKYLAIVAMLLDHVAATFLSPALPLYSILRFCGRITGPIMFFAAAEGYHHTKNVKKYIGRIFLFALFSYFPFISVFENHFDPLRLNVLFTIGFGLLAIMARHHLKDPFLKTLLIAFFYFLSLPADYGGNGVLMIVLFDCFYGKRKMQIAGYLLLAGIEFQLFEMLVMPFFRSPLSFAFLKRTPLLLGYLVVPFLFLLYNGKKGSVGTFSKWMFYVFYPLHLSVIAVLKWILL